MAEPQDPLAWVPSVDIDVMDPSLQGYEHVMNWMAQRDLDRAGPGQDNLFRDVPLTSATEGWRRVNFLYPDRPTVSILIDEIDSYLVAIQKGDGKWLKFSDRPIPLPADHPAVESMDIQSSYVHLTRGFIREQLVFGTPVLTNLYHVLLHFNPNIGLMNREMIRQRKALVQLIVLFCEAVRFRQMRARLLEIMEDGQSVTLPRKMWPWLQEWSTASKFALSCKEREGHGNMQDDPSLLRSVEGLEIKSREDVPGFLGLILRSAFVPAP
ncbi:uncharacterized protein [Setaria viridis]|uniref:rRNA N-glycosylase n=1 Tax=Setaria viridis TaxID=4556 RepID=A0A4V6D4P5_SETVI|nr:uncharacterized protein LOC117864166 isoform X2 [Setaria viridis]TKW07286.1 hypothetical protein SEVIR_7G301203v2 [Setaria viridis]